MSVRTILAGVRPVALGAVSEKERLRAHPHRAQAAVNHVRALNAQRRAEEEKARQERIARKRR